MPNTDDALPDHPLRTERRGGILVITLNRPAVMNAVDVAMARLMAEALDEFEADPSLVAGVITGAGRGFCAGMDLKAFARTGETPYDEIRGFAGIVQRPPTKPLIAAIEGFAVAGGLEIALSCDLLVAARGAKLGIPEATRSIVAAGGALLRLPQALPMPIVKELAFTGGLVTADRAYELGAINRLTHPGGALDAALELAAAVQAAGPLAVAASKRILDAASEWGSGPRFWEEQARIVGPVMASHDAHEGATAFEEKRPPIWTAD